MDVPLVVAALLPTAAVIIVCVVAVARRRRRRTVPVYLNRCTLTIEDGPHAAEQSAQIYVPPGVDPTPPAER